jgi:hypothetical protein
MWLHEHELSREKPYTCIENSRNYYHHQLSVSNKIGNTVVHHSCHWSKNEHNCFTLNCMYMNDAGYEFIPGFA